MSFTKLTHLPDFNTVNFKYLRCIVCPLAKQTKRPFPTSSTTTVAPFDLLHIDLWGPYSIESIIGAKYFVIIVDDFSKTTWTFLEETSLRL